jgi:hypothetical protein
MYGKLVHKMSGAFAFRSIAYIFLAIGKTRLEDGVTIRPANRQDHPSFLATVTIRPITSASWW